MGWTIWPWNRTGRAHKHRLAQCPASSLSMTSCPCNEDRRTHGFLPPAPPLVASLWHVWSQIKFWLDHAFLQPPG